jgi:CO/xanthine dehydrogenase Mo-binding subunit
MLDAWIRVGADGRITVFTGKAELGQGIKTALVQVAAEELVVEPSRIELVTADTGRTPTSNTPPAASRCRKAAPRSCTPRRRRAPRSRSSRRSASASLLDSSASATGAVNGVAYGELVAGPGAARAAPAAIAAARSDDAHGDGKTARAGRHPAKLTGQPIYVQDLRLPGMVHARVLRPPSYGARLKALDSAAAAAMPGVLKVVRDGSFVALVAEREYQAVTRRARWQRLRNGMSAPTFRSPKRSIKKFATLPSETRSSTKTARAAPARR